MNRCDRFPEKSLTALEFDNMSFDSYAVTSSAMKLCFIFSCEIRKINKSISPGQKFTVTLTCLDQLEQPLNNCVVKSDYQSDKFQLSSGELKRTINGNEQLSFHLYSRVINFTSLKIYSDFLCSDSS